MNQNELYHHGVLGQKWGIRRYQPYTSGSAKGKFIGSDRERQQRREDRKNSRVEARAQKKATRQAERQAAREKEQEFKDLKKRSEQYKKDVRRKMAYTDGMTDQELRDAINHIKLERELKDLMTEPKKIGAGRKFINDVVKPSNQAIAKTVLTSAGKAGLAVFLSNMGKKYDADSTADKFFKNFSVGVENKKK